MSQGCIGRECHTVRPTIADDDYLKSGPFYGMAPATVSGHLPAGRPLPIYRSKLDRFLLASRFSPRLVPVRVRCAHATRPQQRTNAP